VYVRRGNRRSCLPAKKQPPIKKKTTADAATVNQLKRPIAPAIPNNFNLMVARPNRVDSASSDLELQAVLETMRSVRFD
jgi:hypothetical protein